MAKDDKKAAAAAPETESEMDSVVSRGHDRQSAPPVDGSYDLSNLLDDEEAKLIAELEAEEDDGTSTTRMPRCPWPKMTT